MSNIEYSIENNPSASDDKVSVMALLVSINSASMRKQPISVYLQKMTLKL